MPLRDGESVAEYYTRVGLPNPDTPKPRFSAQYQYPADDLSYRILPGDLFHLGEDICVVVSLKQDKFLCVNTTINGFHYELGLDPEHDPDSDEYDDLMPRPPETYPGLQKGHYLIVDSETVRTSLAEGYQDILDDDDLPTYMTMFSGGDTFDDAIGHKLDSLLYDLMDDPDAGFLPPIIIQEQTAGSMIYIRDESARNAPDLKSMPEAFPQPSPPDLGISLGKAQASLGATQAPATTDTKPSPSLDLALDPDASPSTPADSNRGPGSPQGKLDPRDDGCGGVPSLPIGTTAAAEGGEGFDTPIKQLFIVAPSPPSPSTEMPRPPTLSISLGTAQASLGATQAPATTVQEFSLYFDFDPDPSRSPCHYDTAPKNLSATDYFDFDPGPGRSSVTAYFDFDPDPGRSPYHCAALNSGHYDAVLKYLSAKPFSTAHLDFDPNSAAA